MSDPHPQRRDGRSKRRPGLEEQRRIVTEAAVALFVERGSRAVSVSQICAAAEVSRPTFYRCFDDKAALLAHVYDVAVRDHVQINLAAVLQDGRTLAQVRSELESMIDRIFERPALAAFLFVESADGGSPAHAIVSASFEDAAARLEAFHEERGRAVPSRTVLKATMAACQWIVHDAILRGLSPPVRADAKRAMWELVGAIFAG